MIDFSTKLVGLDNQIQLRPFDGNVTNQVPENWIPITLAWVVRVSLMSHLPEDKDQSGAQKIERVALALRITENAQLDLTGAETDSIMKRIARNFSALAVYRAAEIIEPASIKRNG